MRYVYTARPEVVSVPPPAALTPPPPLIPVDPMQDLLNRKQEAEKNRYKYHLTENDCALICTNATELHFTAGQVIAEAGASISSVFRVKCGRVSVMKAEVILFDLTPGYFIGEGLFIRGEAQDIFGAALVANGPVILHEVNLPFVRQLMEVDKILSFKIYRHMASKLSALLFSGISKISTDFALQALNEAKLSSRRDSTSSTSSDGSSDVMSTISSSSSGYSSGPSSNSAPLDTSPSSSSFSSSTATVPGTFTGSERDFEYPPRAVIMSGDMVSARASRAKLKKKKACKITGPKLVPFKSYPLDGANAGGQCLLDTQKITVTGGSGFRSKKKIKYNKILDISKTGKNSVTIIYNVQAKTLFFKTEEDLNEFYGLVQSLILSDGKQQTTFSPAPLTPTPAPDTPSLSSSQPLPPSPYPTVPGSPAFPLASSCDNMTQDKKDLMKLAVRQDLKKGDVIVAEGDLYQRIYTVAEGQCVMKKGDRPLVTVQEGEVFGVLTLFHLRPSMLTIEVTSETATLLIIPGYKIQELITTNFPLAVRMHKKAAQLVYGQIEKALLSREGLVTGFGDSNVLL